MKKQIIEIYGSKDTYILSTKLAYYNDHVTLYEQ